MKLAIVFLASIALVNAACAEEAQDSTSEASEGALRTDGQEQDELRPVVLFEEHDGSDIEMTEGQSLIVRLPENPSTGYRWRVVADGALDAPEKTFESYAPRSRVGAGGSAVMRWTTHGKVGTHVITLALSRGANGTPTEKFEARVVVSAPVTFECPRATVVNCMPPYRTDKKARLCSAEYRAWAEENCDVTFTR